MFLVASCVINFGMFIIPPVKLPTKNVIIPTNGSKLAKYALLSHLYVRKYRVLFWHTISIDIRWLLELLLHRIQENLYGLVTSHFPQRQKLEKCKTLKMFSNRLEIIDRKSLNKQHQFALWVWVVESEIASEKHHDQVIIERMSTVRSFSFRIHWKCAKFHHFTIVHRAQYRANKYASRVYLHNTEI